MDIKRVIREELDDFDWVEEIPSRLPKDRDWWIINDVDPYSLEVSGEIQDFVFKQGFTWMSGRKIFVPNKFVAISHRGGTYDQQLGRFGFYRPSDHSPSDIEKYEIGEDDLVYRWSEIIKPIKESDDMDWIRDIKPTDPIGDFLMKKFHEKMVTYLSLGGRKGDIISREWATVEAFLIELRELKENSFVNFLSRVLLQSHVDRPYPHVLKAIEDSGFDVNKSEETKRLYKKFQSYNSFGNRIKRTLKKAFVRENDFDWVGDRTQPSEGVVKLVIHLPNMILEYDVDFKNVEQFLSLVQDYAVEAVEGHMMPIHRIGLNGWAVLNRYPEETQELKVGLNKLKKKVNSYL